MDKKIPVRNITSIAFERWDEKIKNSFVDGFAKEYNLTNNNDYRITNESFKDEQDFDFTLKNSKGSITRIKRR